MPRATSVAAMKRGRPSSRSRRTTDAGFTKPILNWADMASQLLHARIRIVHIPLSHNRTAKSPAKERAARAGSRDPASQPQDPAIPLRTHISATLADHTSPLWAQNGTHDNFQRDSSTLQRLQLAKPQVVNNPHARPSVKSPSELPWVAFCAHEHRGAPIESPA